jgi:putative membrane protein
MKPSTSFIWWSLSTLLFIEAILLGIAPYARPIWFAEMVWPIGLWLILFLTRKSVPFSTTSYVIFFIWMALQVGGAHTSFERVPMDWLMTPLGLVRNPYDRIAHFAIGWFAFPFAELIFHKSWTPTKGLAAFFAIMCTIAMAGLWELIEWAYAVVEGGETGAAFLGSQGDPWDAQKDIGCDSLGALCASLYFLFSRYPHKGHRSSQAEPPALHKTAN